MSAGAIIAQKGEDLTPEVFYTNAGVGAVSLTVTIDVWVNGTNTLSAQAATEEGDGLYSFTLAGSNTTTAGRYTFIFKTSGTVDQAWLAARFDVGGNVAENMLTQQQAEQIISTESPRHTYDLNHSKTPDGAALSWVNFDEGAGTTAADGTSNGNDFILTGGVTWGSTDGGNPGERFLTGSYITADGSTGYASNTGLFDSWPAGGWTICFRLCVRAYGSGGYVLSKYNTESPYNSLDITINSSGALAVGANIANSGKAFAGTSALTIGRWYFIGVIYDPAIGYTVYQDDRIVGINTTKTAIGDGSSAGMSLGARLLAGGPGAYTNVSIDSFRAYPRAVKFSEYYDLMAQRAHYPYVTMTDKLVPHGLIIQPTLDEDQNSIQEFNGVYNSAWVGAGTPFRALARSGWTTPTQFVSYTSADGLSWTRGANVLGGGAGGEAASVAGGSIVLFGGVYYKYYQITGGIRVATSPDMVTWTAATTGVFVVPDSVASAFGPFFGGPGVIYDADENLWIMIANYNGSAGASQLLLNGTSPTGPFTIVPGGRLTDLQHGLGPCGNYCVIKLQDGRLASFPFIVETDTALPSVGMVSFSSNGGRNWTGYRYGLVLQITNEIANQDQVADPWCLFVPELNKTFLYYSVTCNSVQHGCISVKTFDGSLDELVIDSMPFGFLDTRLRDEMAPIATIPQGANVAGMSIPNPTAIIAIQTGLATSTQASAIKLQTDKIGTDAADSSNITTLLSRVPGTIQPQTGDSYTVVSNGTYGNAMLKTVSVAIQGIVTNNNSLLTNGTYGLQALATLLIAVPLAVWNTAQSAISAGATMGKFLLSLMSGGTGPYTYTITVNDGTSPVSGVAVSLTNGTTVQATTTNNSGVATFNVAGAVWVLAAFKPGYTYGGSAITVSSNGNTTVSMVPMVIPSPPSASQTMAYYYTDIPETSITYAMTIQPSGSGLEFDGDPVVVVSDGTTGFWTAPLYKGATYTLQCGSGPVLTFAVPLSAGSSTPLTNLLGLSS